MASTKRSRSRTLLILLPLLLAVVPESTQLQSTQTWSLLNYPPVLSAWRNDTDFCYGGDYKTAAAFVECYGDSVTQLHIIGPAAAEDVQRGRLLRHAVAAAGPPRAHAHRARPLGRAPGEGVPAGGAGDRQRQRQLPLRRAPRGAVAAREPPDVRRRRQHALRRGAGLAREAAVAGRAQPPEQLAAGRAAGVRAGPGVAPLADAGVEQPLRRRAGPERDQEPSGGRPRRQLAGPGVPAGGEEGGQRRAQRQPVQRRAPRRARVLLPPAAPGRVEEPLRRAVPAGAARAAVHRVPQRRGEPLHGAARRQHVLRREPPVRRPVVQPPHREPTDLPDGSRQGRRRRLA